MSQIIEAQKAFLDEFHKWGILDKFVRNELPKDIKEAVAVLVTRKFKDLPFNKETCRITVSAEEQDEVNDFISDYLVTLGYARFAEKKPVIPIIKRLLEKGKTYRIASGSWTGLYVELRGSDVEVYGCPWDATRNVPACEYFLYRAQTDRVNLDGPFFVCRSGKRDFVFAEYEIGDKIKS